MNYHRMDTANMVNGRGIRTVIWVSGCPHHCKACFNPTTWHECGGKPFDYDAYITFMDGVRETYCDGVTFSGGDPLAPYNRGTVTQLAKEVKALGKTVWVYTGYTYEEVKDLEIMEYVDVLIDGRFILSQFNPNLKWRGSNNQRLVMVQETRKSGEIVLHPDNNTFNEFYPEKAFNPCEGMTWEEIKEKYVDNVCDDSELELW